MKAIEIAEFGGPQVLRLTERPQPVAARGEVLIRVEAFGINRPDVLQRKGQYPMPPGVTDLPGLEVAGVIECGDAGDLEAAGLRLGDRVCALVAGGGYAQWCAAPIGQILPVPTGWDAVQAASVPETYFTVWQNLFQIARLQEGEAVLVHGGSSGIGVAAIQLAKAAGARVAVTVGSSDKGDACVALGAEKVILYRSQDFVQEALAWTQGTGVDVILDMVGGDYVGRGVQCLAADGRLALIATQGGLSSAIDVGAVLRKRLTISGSTLRQRSLAYKADLARQLRQTVWPWLESGQVKPIVHTVLSALDGDAGSRAHALMESGAHIGKIVLKWN